ncbi:MAG: hypothetical protein ACUVX9_09645 [Anaerolineae bacterium]
MPTPTAYIGYVLAPFSGEVWSKECYCHMPGCNNSPPCEPSGCTHTVTQGAGWGRPFDIGGALNTVVKFYASVYVRSIRIEYVGNICADTSLHPWTDGIKVHMYGQSGASGTYFGAVLYGHLKDRGLYVSNGQVINSGSNISLGKLPSDCACGCSSGIHVHMEATNSLTYCPIGCHGNAVQGSSAMYSFDAGMQ